MRKSDAFFLLTAGQLIVLALLLGFSALSTRVQPESIRHTKDLVRSLGLTDLCLFTEARYTRHLSQADLFTPFQDFPLSQEHFPSGSFVQPPPGIEKLNAPLD